MAARHSLSACLIFQALLVQSWRTCGRVRNSRAGSRRTTGGCIGGGAVLALRVFTRCNIGTALPALTEASEGATEARQCRLSQRLQRGLQRQGRAGSHRGFRGWNRSRAVPALGGFRGGYRGRAVPALTEASEAGTEAGQCLHSEASEGGTEAQYCHLPQKLQRLDQKHSTAASHSSTLQMLEMKHSIDCSHIELKMLEGTHSADDSQRCRSATKLQKQSAAEADLPATTLFLSSPLQRAAE
ncbi:uncharacterized protein [Pleurodeles waltl]|uniref:uncharacterized protein n=1 Tax=Pleurodeles waltl TaxID=8319 RepID=UPI0037099A58